MKSMTLRFVAALALATSAFGQATISTLNTAYTQNFDTLTPAGAWTDNLTLPGWYARTTATASISTFGLNTGGTTTAGLYSFGSTSASDRALGFAASNAFTGSASSGQGFIGLRVTNSTGAAATSFSLSYDGEQWRKENNAATHSLIVQYAFNAASLTDTNVTWTTINDLTFTSPIAAATTAAALDGNLGANRQSLSSIVGTTWANGAQLWIRWSDLNDSGNDHQLAIDNVSVTAIPEPSTYAAIFGALALAGVVVHRRRQARR